MSVLVSHTLCGALESFVSACAKKFLFNFNLYFIGLDFPLSTGT